jgi:hypothetical protein
MITQLVAEALRPSGNAQTSSKAESSIQLKLHTLLPVQPQRLPGYRGDIPAVDVVQVNETLGDALGKWAFGNDGGCVGPRPRSDPCSRACRRSQSRIRCSNSAWNHR